MLAPPMSFATLAAAVQKVALAHSATY
eukprot:SAG11_NODE_30430_length_301_cov_0.722772_1_plen_26_part_01